MVTRRPTSVVAIAVAVLAGCEQPEMANQPRYEAGEAAPDWPDDQSARQPVGGTIARNDRVEPAPRTLPMAVDRALLKRGRERFEIFCTPCHGYTGYGNGMIVQRGYPPPPSLHSQRLRDVRPRHIYNVITDGYGVMYSYADRVPARDRWAIAAYIEALQLSQNARPQDLTAGQRQRLEPAP